MTTYTDVSRADRIMDQVNSALDDIVEAAVDYFGDDGAIASERTTELLCGASERAADRVSAVVAEVVADAETDTWRELEQAQDAARMAQSDVVLLRHVIADYLAGVCDRRELERYAVHPAAVLEAELDALQGGDDSEQRLSERGDRFTFWGYFER